MMLSQGMLAWRNVTHESYKLEGIWSNKKAFSLIREGFFILYKS